VGAGCSAIGSAITLGFLDSDLKTDPRYDRCECKKRYLVWRILALRVVWVRRNQGGETVGLARLGGYFGAAAIANRWKLDRVHTAGTVIESASISMAVTGGLNIVREFWK